MSSSKKALIVIPARFGSSRFPGKPLVKIAGKSLLQHVCEVARLAALQLADTEYLVATDDELIMQHAYDLGAPCVMTASECASGTDRIIAAVEQLSYRPEIVLNLQGDAPLTPVDVIVELIASQRQSDYPVSTPATRLSWQQLELLRRSKQASPFSGTTVVVNQNSEALWFSKQIIPALRNEEALKNTEDLSPVLQHLGLYAYSWNGLEAFASLPMGYYEQLEGLEQLRFLENGYRIKVLQTSSATAEHWRGVDTPQDAEFVAQLLGKKNA